ncbi:MAG: DUF1211 domain-containing protein [Chloroflexi bacterium]|nr:MAG: DUF1211 domain-containing protein [Chloroflexota bacterium]
MSVEQRQDKAYAGEADAADEEQERHIPLVERHSPNPEGDTEQKLQRVDFWPWPGDALPRFRNRSESVSRLEGFSDTAFGFAITLLVVSLAVPNRFDELLQQLRGLPVVAVTFALVATIWYAQLRLLPTLRPERRGHSRPDPAAPLRGALLCLA